MWRSVLWSHSSYSCCLYICQTSWMYVSVYSTVKISQFILPVMVTPKCPSACMMSGSRVKITIWDLQPIKKYNWIRVFCCMHVLAIWLQSAQTLHNYRAHFSINLPIFNQLMVWKSTFLQDLQFFTFIYMIYPWKETMTIVVESSLRIIWLVLAYNRSFTGVLYIHFFHCENLCVYQHINSRTSISPPTPGIGW